MSLGIGVIGCGSVFAGPYATMIDALLSRGRVHVSAVYDLDERKRRAAATRYDVDPGLPGPAAVIADDDVDVVLVLTSMNEHGALAREALEAGKHVLVEKPMATSLSEAGELVELSRRAPGLLVCAPHIVLSPTFRAVHEAARSGAAGRLLSARARYGWAGPWWSDWFYRSGGGALFDLGVYNVTSLCALFGPAQRVTAMVGVAIPERTVDGRMIRVEAEDNAHVLLDFGRNDEGAWRVHPESEPHWQWTVGLRHLVDCVETGRPTITRPEHAYHALEIMLAAQAAGRDGVARTIESDFPELVYDERWIEAEAAHLAHDRRSHDGL